MRPRPGRAGGLEGRVLALCLAVGFTTLLDQAIVALAVPAMRVSLAPSPADIQWITAGYSLAFGLALVPSGRLGDLLGRRRLFLLGVVVFSGFSLIGGMATEPWIVVVARLVQGAGAGIVNPQVLGYIQDLFQGDARAKALGAYTTMAGLSAVVGPLLAGILLVVTPADIGWRLVFLLNVPLGVVILVVAWRILPRGAAQSPPPARRAGLDGVGLLLLGIAVLAVMVPTIQPLDPPLWAAAWLLVAACLLVAFVLWELSYQRRGRSPVLVPALVRSGGYLLGSAVAMLQFGAALGFGLVSTLFLLDGLGLNPFAVAVISLPRALGMIAGSALSWRLVVRFGRSGVVVAIAGGLVALIVEIVGMVILDPAAIVVLVVVVGFVQGVCGGLVSPSNQTLTLAFSPPGHAGVAAGFLQLVQRFAAAVCIAACGGAYLARAVPGDLASAQAGLTVAGWLAVLVTVLSLAAAAADAGRRRRADPGAEPL